MKFFLTSLLALGLSTQGFASESKQNKVRKPNQAEQTCVTFTGAGAKKTFMTLYPFTQASGATLVAEESRDGDTAITTANIFCRVYELGISGDTSKLKKVADSKFQCGYTVAADGNLTACSDPM